MLRAARLAPGPLITTFAAEIKAIPPCPPASPHLKKQPLRGVSPVALSLSLSVDLRARGEKSKSLEKSSSNDYRVTGCGSYKLLTDRSSRGHARHSLFNVERTFGMRRARVNREHETKLLVKWRRGRRRRREQACQHAGNRSGKFLIVIASSDHFKGTSTRFRVAPFSRRRIRINISGACLQIV